MALIDNIQRIDASEFKNEDRDTVERIAYIYNYFAEQTSNIINGNITFDNLNRELLTIEVTVNSSGIPVGDSKFTSSLGLSGINVIKSTNLTNSTTYPTSAPFITFDNLGNNIYNIKHIAGLPANNKFNLTLELISD